ncbi:Succinate--CoA ligase [GDP-forming] subunit beta, mitochondrial [Merluccius polli]|uniref:succinate--CoA ligase (GDP-forming) n=1 Tax=Merluccius polli TaxID=89951 RepID=A0AA47MVA1_MERPO|nr:Succinate--CoA ligase [GDP-forming] subunit beta, mitochondrial [Merluccius polli]
MAPNDILEAALNASHCASWRPRLLPRGTRRKHPGSRPTSRRWLNLQEYQSKKLMEENGVAVQRFYVADTAAEALDAAKRLDAKEIVLKAQILAGGRGKGVFDSGLKGGVHLTKDPMVVGDLAHKMLGFNLSTKQTPKEGVKVKTSLLTSDPPCDVQVMVAEALDITRETYFAILMDRACNGPVMVGSPQGGVDIEEVAASTPELIFKEVIDIFEGVQDDQALRMASNLGFKGPLERQAADQIKKLYDLFLKVDATQVEVNPLGETPEGQVVCFDAKINFDDNAEFRQKAVFAMDDMSESDPTESEAAKWDLKYIGLDGNIACFVNGAGLAMATCDIIDLHGGKPANFLDLGGGVQERQVYEAFKLLTADPKYKCLFHNYVRMTLQRWQPCVHSNTNAHMGIQSCAALSGNQQTLVHNKISQVSTHFLFILLLVVPSRVDSFIPAEQSGWLVPPPTPLLLTETVTGSSSLM